MLTIPRVGARESPLLVGWLGTFFGVGRVATTPSGRHGLSGRRRAGGKALPWAAAKGKAEVARLLIDAGATE